MATAEGSRASAGPPGSPGGGTGSFSPWIAVFFAAVVFASAFLIFLVQPMVGKRILPWFGGAPTVWILCLAFYQSALFLGYAYAHCLIRFVPIRAQVAIHALMSAAAMAVLPVLPGEGWQPAAAADPGLRIVVMLAVNVGLPFIVLAATGPLTQAWFVSVAPGRSPYGLYAVSNLGSLMALLGYPFVLEPVFSLSRTGVFWSAAFALTAASVLVCAALAARASFRGGGRLDPPGPDARRPAASRIALWVLLPACAVILLMGVTNELCLDLASVPFLWVLPLCVYLLTFIVCFGTVRVYRRALFVFWTALPIVLPAMISMLGIGGGVIGRVAATIQFQIGVFAWLLFGGCMVLHGELYRLRPDPRLLTTFYLCLSGGGALGGLFVGLAAPLVFADYHELQLSLSLGVFLLLAACWNDTVGWLHRGVAGWKWVVAVTPTVILLGVWASSAVSRPGEVIRQERSFFGVLRVLDEGSGRRAQRQLYSGTTLHGTQFQKWKQRPSSYYGTQAGIGIALLARPEGLDTEIGVVGLGIGTLAAYGRPGDRFRFYEIDRSVIQISRDEELFTYLSNTLGEVEIIEGDGRVRLAAELDQRDGPLFDILVVDAFSSDAIPVHLLTREAFEIYARVIGKGLLAVHASSQHLDLVPVIARVGQSIGFDVLGIRNENFPSRLTKDSIWMFLSLDRSRISGLERLVKRRAGILDSGALEAFRIGPQRTRPAPLWTDDYSDLLRVVRPMGSPARKP
ncbi:MAG: ferrichrome ABC transporter permease [Myxococcota bacterium]|nr:ferrichrome ABC transporter permease [Myxococcota bacterium]